MERGRAAGSGATADEREGAQKRATEREHRNRSPGAKTRIRGNRATEREHRKWRDIASTETDRQTPSIGVVRLWVWVRVCFS